MMITEKIYMFHNPGHLCLLAGQCLTNVIVSLLCFFDNKSGIKIMPDLLSAYIFYNLLFPCLICVIDKYIISLYNYNINLLGGTMRLLLCEDEEDISSALSRGLRKLNYYVDTAMDGEEALELYYESDYDLIILDINMPKLDGFEVLKAIREDDSDKKILILSARDSIDDKVAGLDLGANDYLAKPFDFKELEARVRALLRTSYTKSSDEIRLESSDITLLIDKKQVLKSGEIISLTPKEYSIFEYLCCNKNSLVSTSELLEHNIDMNANDASQVIKVHIASIRKKLGSNVIKTNRGMGYTVND